MEVDNKIKHNIQEMAAYNMMGVQLRACCSFLNQSQRILIMTIVMSIKDVTVNGRSLHLLNE